MKHQNESGKTEQVVEVPAIALGTLRKTGRPRKLPNFDVIERYAAAGLTDKQMALCMDCSETTLKTWKRDKVIGPQIAACLKRGHSRANHFVVESLFKRALGYTTEKVTLEEKLDKQGEIVNVRKVERVELAASEIAAMMWLSNKDPDNWKQKQDIGITQNTRVVAVELKGLDAEGRRNLIKQFEAERQRRLGQGKSLAGGQSSPLAGQIEAPKEAKFTDVTDDQNSKQSANSDFLGSETPATPSE